MLSLSVSTDYAALDRRQTAERGARAGRHLTTRRHPGRAFRDARASRIPEARPAQATILEGNSAKEETA